jgi:uncharacterized protein (TIGR02646 family)
MRFVRRSERPSVLDDDNSTKMTELAKARVFYGPPDPTNPRRKFEFTHYKHPDVKVAMEEDFYRKCAYCESYYAATQPVDVEHWRPKAAVEEEDGSEIKPGYYELALDWDNLLPSCIDCNRVRYHKDAVTGKERKLGKGNRFPLRDPKTRGKVAQEDPLLINPCKDRPSDHLAWNPTDTSVLDASTDKGRISIEVYGLNRYDLVAARRDVLFKLRLHLKQLETLCRLKAKPGNTDRQTWLLDQFIEEELLALKAFTREEAPYSEMCKEEVRRTMPTRFGQGAPL